MQEKWNFSQGGALSIFHFAGLEMFLTIITFVKMYTFDPLFFKKICFFLKNEIDNLSSNFTGTTILCISID
jgi:hypothetical protein